MKLTKTLLYASMPFILFASACVLDVDTRAESLTTEVNPNFGVNDCGESLQQSLLRADWPIDTILAGDMELTKEELLDHLQSNPGVRSDLIAEMAAAQLNMVVAMQVPSGVLDDLAAADRWLATSEEDEEAPPTIIVDGGFGSLRGFNRSRGLECFDNPPSVLEQTAGAPSSVVVDGAQTRARRLER